MKMVLCLLVGAWSVSMACGAAATKEEWKNLAEEPIFGLEFMPKRNHEVNPKSYYLHNPAVGREAEVPTKFDYQFMPTQEQGKQPKSYVLRMSSVGGAVAVCTNATGILRVTTVYPEESESQPSRGNFRIISKTVFELYPLPGQAGTNRIAELSIDNINVVGELRWLAGQEVRVEGCLFGPYLIVTNVTEHGAKKSFAATNLNPQQAHALAKKLMRFHLGDRMADSALERSAPPKLIDGRWVWVWRGGSGSGDFEAKISFAKDGTSSEYDWRSFISAVQTPR